VSDNRLSETQLAASVAHGRLTDPADDAQQSVPEPREGSTLHYALLRTPPAARTRVIHALDLIQTISHAIVAVQEPQVANTKLQALPMT